MAHTAPSFRFTEEFYQFRAFSRDRVRVLLTLDTHTVDLSASGVNRTDGDFALAWIRNYGKGRVFYSAFGHFPESFTREPVRTMLLQALLWLTAQIDVDASPRSGPSAPAPTIAPGGIRDPSGGGSDAFAPGSIVVITGDHLTSGSFFDAISTPLPTRLAGTHIEVNGIPAPLFSVRPDRLLLQLPFNIPAQTASLTISSVNIAAAPVPIIIGDATPAIVAATRDQEALVIYLTGLGATDPPLSEGHAASPATLARTVVQLSISVAGKSAMPFFSGLTPGFVGLYQINALLHPDTPSSFEIIVEAAGRRSQPFQYQP